MKNALFVFFFAFLTLLTSSLVAQNNVQAMDEFGALPVLHEGRVKPLDSAARAYARIVTGSENPNGQRAIDWLARLLFDPANMTQEPLVLIKGADLQAQFGLDESEMDHSRISLENLMPKLAETAPRLPALLQADPNTLTAQQRDFIAVHDNAATLTGLMRSLSIILPLDVVVPEEYKAQIEGENLSYAELAGMETPLSARLQKIIRAKGEDLNAYTEEEKKIALLAFQLQSVRGAASGSSGLLAIIPANWGAENGGNWYAPWDLVLQGQGSPQSAAYLENWRDIAEAFRASNSAAWDDAVAQTAQALEGQNLYSKSRFSLEIFYNAVKPYEWARGFYALAIGLMAAFLFNVVRTYLRPLALASGALAMTAHVTGIASRVIILERPPVGTLYESVLFVALICALSGFLAAIWRRGDLAYLAGLIAALGLLFIAPVIVPQGETLEVLVAVLNTNFWLATHVTIITAGYGVSVLAACLAHFYMIARLYKPRRDVFFSALHKTIYKTSIVALLLTAVGTVLGGIWADQSWGRFWGWDPKENGALLIVLWLIWLQHGRLSGHLRDLPFMAGIASLNVVVALAWFGVNLLGVGLHSYGFTTGLALGLGLFCALETLFIGGIWTVVRFKERNLDRGA